MGKGTELFKFSLFFLIVIGAEASAQTLRITTRDKADGKLVPYVNFSLENMADKKLIKQGTTGNDGISVFELKAGDAQLSIRLTAIGYYPIENEIHFKGKDTSLIFEMRASESILKEVVIKGSRDAIVSTPEGYTVNVDKVTAANNINAEQLLKKLPGITPDQNGQLQLMGKPVTIWIDGKPSLLAGTELDNFLRTLSPAAIKNIKVLTNPSAFYDAGAGNVIEIITKKNLIKGISGTLSGNAGTHDKYNGAVSANYNSGIYAGKYSLSFDRNNSWLSEHSEQVNFDQPIERRQYQYKGNRPQAPENSILLSLGNDFQISSNSILGLNFKYNRFSSLPYSQNSLLNVLNDLGKQTGYESYNRKDSSISNIYYYNVNYRYSLKKKGAFIVADAYYWQRKANNGFNEASATSAGLGSLFANEVDQRLNIKSAMLYINYPLSANMLMLTGLKMTQFHISSDQHILNQGTGSGIVLFEPNEAFSLTYKESVPAAFATFAGTFHKMQYQAGVRFEGTSLALNSSNPSETGLSSQNYNGFYPSVALSYPLSKTQRITLGYNKKIYRVSYSQLNPVNFRNDPTTSVKGNPALLPSQGHTLNLSYSVQLSSKNSLMISASYLHEINPYTWFTLPADSSGNFIQTPLNYHADNYATINVFSQNKLTFWLNFNANFLASTTQYNFDGLAYPVPERLISVKGSGTATFIFSPTFSGSIFGIFKTPSSIPFGRGFAYHYVDLSIAKSFGNDKYSLSAYLNDVFNQNYTTTNLLAPSYSKYTYQKRESRILRVSFSYRFGTKKSGAEYKPQEDERFSN